MSLSLRFDQNSNTGRNASSSEQNHETGDPYGPDFPENQAVIHVFNELRAGTGIVLHRGGPYVILEEDGVDHQQVPDDAEKNGAGSNDEVHEGGVGGGCAYGEGDDFSDGGENSSQGLTAVHCCDVDGREVAHNPEYATAQYGAATCKKKLNL